MNAALDSAPLLSVQELGVTYALAGGVALRAVEDVSLDVARGETLALVGESGCGKSSIAKAVLQLHPISSGRVLLQGRDLGSLGRRELREARRSLQMIFQDPIASLNPRRRVRDILEAPLRIHGIGTANERRAHVERVLALVHMDPAAVLDRYPHEFSGGQCQRLSIARAIILEPSLLVCDEAVSALDVSVRAQILNVLNELRTSLGLSMLFISHDLAVVRNVADRIAVMYLGKICEIGSTDAIFLRSAHPYTAALIRAVPVADPDVPRPEPPSDVGEIPSPLAPPSGCRFRTRCPMAQAICSAEVPTIKAIGNDHAVACHFPRSADGAAGNPNVDNQQQ